MKSTIKRAAMSSLALGLVFSGAAIAAVSNEEAAKLKTELTPMGAEKAGNKAGTIPAWDGGLTKAPTGYKEGDTRADPYAAEKPLVSISARNMDQYADKLSDGVKALMKKYPSYRIDVYPSHRTAAMPQWAYDNTLKNATRCKTRDGGQSLEGCYGGVPFPLPKTGAELMWNHLLAWKGQANSMLFRLFVVTSDGKPTMASDGLNEVQSPYWFKDGSLEKFGGDYNNLMLVTYGPPFKAGESILLRDTVDAGKGRQAWQYLVGQRRTRKAPTLGYDTPDSVASGAFYFDEAFGFSGGLDRYDWKVIGKKELYIPYNTNRTWLAKSTDLLGPQHLNPDHIRWELHRVWEVEATVAPGKRHAVPKRRYYLDEDTYTAALADMWDGQGQIWRVGYTLPMAMPDVPGTIAQSFGLYNLLAGTYVLANYPGEKAYQFKQVPPWNENYFTPENLAAKGSR
ncbi:DUF1329 domain-containing protein [Duganella radicis]|uniref:DUF1329 domain-containing protein n=1 Tax=Duganella radicis TaxID=551988 RepID=A0A6L6PFE2_9BURK|nr:DUF1329 domain-containing protein [Duganella radicis]MTV37005.1 DUF1329 domain-containing protein [Duganella radicis]